MTCRCGAHMCYVCRAPIQGYEHFCQHTHTPGRGCNVACGRCLTFTNTEQDDALAVHEAKAQAEKEVNGEAGAAPSGVDSNVTGAAGQDGGAAQLPAPAPAQAQRDPPPPPPQLQPQPQLRAPHRGLMMQMAAAFFPWGGPAPGPVPGPAPDAPQALAQALAQAQPQVERQVPPRPNMHAPPQAGPQPLPMDPRLNPLEVRARLETARQADAQRQQIQMQQQQQQRAYRPRR
jgi:hypothetical protein